jgi:PAS domain S-box-containing protein
VIEAGTLVDLAPDAIFVAEPDGRLSFVNDAACRLLGCARGELVGRPVAELVPPAQLDCLRRSSVDLTECELRRKDGSWVPVEARARILDTGQWQGFVRDISARLRMEQAIRSNERLLKSIFDILPVGIWIADRTGRIVSNNPAGERIWKGVRYVPVAEFGQYKGWWVDTGKPIAAEEWALARALDKGETSLGELVRIQCFDGSFKTILNSAVPLHDESGAISGAIVVNEDITALHEAQEKQRASEQLLRTVFDLLPVGLWITDREGRITLANPAGRRIWQGAPLVAPEQYGQYRGWWVESGKPIAPEEWGLSRAIRRGETSRGELIRVQSFDGAFRTVINWAAPIRSDAGEIVGAVAVNEDITSLQHTQEQLRAAVRDREEILAIVAHDLRNPLSGLMMGASAVEHRARALPGGEPVRELAASLTDIARRMSGLVDDLLAVAVATSGGPSMLRLAPVPASRLLAKAADAARPRLAKDGLALAVHAPADLPSVSVDADRILRVFANLLDNALKFTSAPGQVTLAAERTSGGVRFSVANSGAALEAGQLDAMFQPFWQAGRDRRGAGLGLSICRSIVEAHGGTIWAEPAEGQRVRVCFVLPRQPAGA